AQYGSDGVIVRERGRAETSRVTSHCTQRCRQGVGEVHAGCSVHAVDGDEYPAAWVSAEDLLSELLPDGCPSGT
ncbi:hypothetical protein, partial [Arcanobacterium phocae]|uniref:hypothetical protein n=1 Tax=Arcanobacterium phocae TaxID=131112 RepID=UPI001C0FECCE